MTLREQAKQALSRDADGAGSAALVFTLRASLANANGTSNFPTSRFRTLGIPARVHRAIARSVSRESTLAANGGAVSSAKSFRKPVGIGRSSTVRTTPRRGMLDCKTSPYSKAGQAVASAQRAR